MLRRSGHRRPIARRFARLYAGLSPAAIRCGWGVERNRHGGRAVLAILALPAVAGKFGVRGGGFTMSDSGAWTFERSWVGVEEPATRDDQHEPAWRTPSSGGPPVAVLVVYNCNPP